VDLPPNELDPNEDPLPEEEPKEGAASWFLEISPTLNEDEVEDGAEAEAERLDVDDLNENPLEEAEELEELEEVAVSFFPNAKEEVEEAAGLVSLSDVDFFAPNENPVEEEEEEEEEEDAPNEEVGLEEERLNPEEGVFSSCFLSAPSLVKDLLPASEKPEAFGAERSDEEVE